jgi:hypothetical protein
VAERWAGVASRAGVANRAVGDLAAGDRAIGGATPRERAGGGAIGDLAVGDRGGETAGERACAGLIADLKGVTEGEADGPATSGAKEVLC